MKKYLIALVIMLLPITAFSASTSYTCLGVSYPIMVNGSPMAQSTVPTMNYNGRTLLPLRAVSEALNVPIEWDSINKKVVINTIDTDKLKESCVEIYVSKNGQDVEQGSGVLIDYNKILTCYHVTNKGTSYRVLYNGASNTNGTLGDCDTDVDISVLTPNFKDVKPVKVGDSDNVKVGDKVYTISSPKQNKNVVTQGVVKSFWAYKGIPIFEVTAVGDAGSSGGACFNSNGELIGIINAGNNINLNNYVVPINNIRKELAN